MQMKAHQSTNTFQTKANTHKQTSANSWGDLWSVPHVFEAVLWVYSSFVDAVRAVQGGGVDRGSSIDTKYVQLAKARSFLQCGIMDQLWKKSKMKSSSRF